MFRIVQLEDGSTAIYDRVSGKQVSVIQETKKSTPPAAAAAKKATAQQPGDAAASTSQTSPARPTSSAAAAAAAAETATSSTPAPAAGSSSTPVEPVASNSRSDSSPTTRSRTLRPRNAGTEYNEDKRFETLLRAKRITTSAASAPTHNGRKSTPPAAKGPDHLVVVFKQQGDSANAVPAPNRMRLLPAATFSKLRQEVAAKAGDKSSASDEPEAPELDRDTFCRYLNLIPTKDMKRLSFDELETNWPLRQHARRRPVKRHIVRSNAVLDPDDFPPPVKQSIRIVSCASEPNNNSTSKSNQNGSAKSPPMSKGKWLASLKAKAISSKVGALVVRSDEGMLQLAPAPLNVPIVNVPLFSTLHKPLQPLSSQSKREQALMYSRNLTRYVAKFAKIEFSSPLGRWLPDLYPYARLTPEEKRRHVRHHHELMTRASLRHEWLDQRPTFEFTYMQFIPGVVRASRSTRQFTVSGIGYSSVALPSNFVHTYTFSRQERMEKFLTLDTGLDWRGRLKAMDCQPLSVVVTEIRNCTCCRSRICTKKGHSCGKEANKEQMEPRRAVDHRPSPTNGALLASTSLKRSSGSSDDSDVGSKRLRTSARKSLSPVTPTSQATKPMATSNGNNIVNHPRRSSSVQSCGRCQRTDCSGQCLTTRQNAARKSLPPPLMAAPQLSQNGAPVRRSQMRQSQESSSPPNLQPQTIISPRTMRTRLVSPAAAQEAAYQIEFEPTNNVKETRARASLPSRTSSLASNGLRHQVVTSTTPTRSSRSGHNSQSHSNLPEEDVILIGENRSMVAPPILLRSLSQQSSTQRERNTISGSLSTAHAALLNIHTLRQNVHEKLKSGSVEHGSGLRKGYYDKKSQIMIEEV